MFITAFQLPHIVVSQGKFIRINFDVTGYIVGANIETCILSVGGFALWKTASVWALFVRGIFEKDISHSLSVQF